MAKHSFGPLHVSIITPLAVCVIGVAGCGQTLVAPVTTLCPGVHLYITAATGEAEHCEDLSLDSSLIQNSLSC